MGHPIIGRLAHNPGVNIGDVGLAAGMEVNLGANPGVDIGDVDVPTVMGQGAGQATMANSIPVVVASDQGALDSDAIVITEAAWTTIIDAVRIDDDPTSFNSAAHDVDGWSAVWLLIDIDSTLTPTHLRVLVQFSDDGGTTWWDFEEGLWASLGWEDVGTGGGINKAFLLPCSGIDDIRIRVVGTGTNATNYFDVTVKVRAFRGGLVAHA